MDNDNYFESYGQCAVHRLMLADDARLQTFKDAINQSVRPGDVVLDLGTGTGILSLFAAAAGAARVHAVDVAEVIATAEEIAVLNGLNDRIEFSCELGEKLVLPSQVDVIISEWMGYFGLAETMFLSMLDARVRHLKPGGTLIPSHLRLYLAPIADTELYRTEGLGLWESPLHGFDFSPMLQRETDDPYAIVARIPTSACVAEPARLVEIDCRTAKSTEFFFDVEVDFTFERSTDVHGFCGYFDVQLSESILLSTGPESPPTHWQQTYFPVSRFSAAAGDRLTVGFRAQEPDPDAPRWPLYLLDYDHYRGETKIGSGSFWYSSANMS